MMLEYSLEIIAGIPAGNARKMLEAVKGYAEVVKGFVDGEGFTLNDVPSSAGGRRTYRKRSTGW